MHSDGCHVKVPEKYQNMTSFTAPSPMIIKDLRTKHGAGDRSRTYDLRITNALLYQLSYTGKPFRAL